MSNQTKINDEIRKNEILIKSLLEEINNCMSGDVRNIAEAIGELKNKNYLLRLSAPHSDPTIL